MYTKLLFFLIILVLILESESKFIDFTILPYNKVNKLYEILLNISKNNPNTFLQKELALRKEKKLPPFYRLISLIISGKSEQAIMQSAINLKSKLPKLNGVNVLGPVLAPITKLRKKYRCRILIRYPKDLFIQKYLSQSLNKIKMMPGIKLEVDVDPINFS